MDRQAVRKTVTESRLEGGQAGRTGSQVGRTGGGQAGKTGRRSGR